MEDILYCKDMHEPIEGVAGKPADMADDKWRKLHRKTVGTIRQWVDDSVFHHVSEETDAEELWKKLESLFEKKTAAKKAFLFKEMINMKFNEDKSVVVHLNDFQNVTNQLATMGMKIGDEILAFFLLGTLPDSWETFVVTLTNSASDGVLSMDTVKNNMLNKEIRRKAVGIDDGHERARVVKGRDKNSGLRFSGTCHYCGEKGHIKWTCRKWKQDKKKGNYQSFTATVSGELLTVQECLYVGDKGHGWFVDTGASCHVTSNLELFTTYEASDFGILKMGNRGWSKISGMGDICIETDLGYHMTLKDVRHVSDLCVNILSASALDRQGFHQYIGDGKWKRMNGLLEVARGGLCCSLYKTHNLVYKDDLSAMGDTSLGVWHQSDGHIRKKGVLENMSHISFSNGCSDQEEDGQELFHHWGHGDELFDQGELHAPTT